MIRNWQHSKAVVIGIFILLIFLLCAQFDSLQAQKENSYTRSGNSAFKEQKMDEAEIAYRKALELNPKMAQALFNLGDVLYVKNDSSALEWFQKAIPLLKEPQQKAFAWYNSGNVHMKNERWEKAIDSYKESLKLNPSDMDAKYNLAYAQSKLKKEQQQQQQQQQQQNQQQQQQNQQQEEQKNQDNSSGKQDEQQQKQQSPQQQKLSKEEAKKLLEAVRNEESKLNQKIQKEKQPAGQKSAGKDW